MSRLRRLPPFASRPYPLPLAPRLPGIGAGLLVSYKSRNSCTVGAVIEPRLVRKLGQLPAETFAKVTEALLLTPRSPLP